MGRFAAKPKPGPMPRRYFARTVPVTLSKAQTLCFRECREATIAFFCRSSQCWPRRQLLVFFAALATADTPAEAHTNRLIHSASPYLLDHAHNPVDWYPWGEEAIAKAKKENKLIFLSIGYSTCYWCHVAERTIYSNPVIAALMNQWFVNIKVDREERPDIDGTFMRARRLLTELRRVAKQSVSDAGSQALFCRKLLSSRGPGGHERLSDHSQTDP